MQSDKQIKELIQSATFRKLVRKRIGMSFALSGIMLLIYSFYFITMAWFPDFLGTPLHDDTVISRGIWLAAFCVVFSVLISGFYVWWANNHFDKAKQSLLEELSDAKE